MLTTIAAMNALGVTHNDIKPENIMVVNNKHYSGPKKELILTDPQFRLIDLAYASKDCVIAGTCTYYGPEQLANQGGVVRQFGSVPRAALAITPKVDVWAMGCVLVEMYSG
jgi:serine/threonine protein kinase